MPVVYKREMRQYFSTPVGYVFIAAVLLIGGIYCISNNLKTGYQTFETALNNLPFFLVFLIPVLTSPVFSEEKKQKTDQLLYTLPLTTGQIVTGKYLALLTVWAVPMGIFMFYPPALSIFGDVNIGQSYANILALYLIGCVMISVCMFISAFCENIIVSTAVSFVIMFLMNQLSSLSGSLNSGTAELVSGRINLRPQIIDVFSRLTIFMNGVIDITSLIYFAGVSFIFVSLTAIVFERRRWAG